MFIPPLIGSNFITAFVNGRQQSVTKQDGRFPAILAALKDKNYELAFSLFDKPAALAKYSHGEVRVFEGKVLFKDQEVTGVLVERILSFLNQDLPFEPLVAFLNNLYINTDERVRVALYPFIEANHLGITEDGAMLAYKLTKDDGSPYYHPDPNIRYAVGQTYTIPRESISSEGECNGVGLYTGNRTYWNTSFNEKGDYTGDGRMFVAKVFPQDVVSIPSSESSKLRACKIEIIAEYSKVQNEVNKPVYITSDGSYFTDKAATVQPINHDVNTGQFVVGNKPRNLFARDSKTGRFGSCGGRRALKKTKKVNFPYDAKFKDIPVGAKFRFYEPFDEKALSKSAWLKINIGYFKPNVRCVSGDGELFLKNELGVFDQHEKVSVIAHR